MTAITEESLSVSGILLAKVFNRGRLRGRALPRRRTAADPAAGRAGDDRPGLLRHGADVLRHHAGADLPGRGLLITGGSAAATADRRHAGRLHHPAGPAADAADPADAGHPRRADVAGPVPADLRVPRPGAGDRERPGARPLVAHRGRRARRVPRRLVPLPGAARAAAAARPAAAVRRRHRRRLDGPDGRPAGRHGPTEAEPEEPTAGRSGWTLRHLSLHGRAAGSWRRSSGRPARARRR